MSNERIPLSEAMRMVFEINSLKNATPATGETLDSYLIDSALNDFEPYSSVSCGYSLYQ